MTYSFRTIDSASIKSGTRVLLRLDLNLPIVDGVVRDDFRIKRSLPTLQYLKKGATRTVILCHTDNKKTDSLELVAECLKKYIDLIFVKSVSELPERLTTLRPGGFLFLENLRRNPGEVSNDNFFAKELSSLGDVYVNEAFSVSHRPHASIVGIPKFLPSYAGFLFAEEVSKLSKVFNPPRPFFALLAGAKLETKFPLAKKFLKTADSVFVGGALANDLFKARGYEIGLSKHSSKDFGFSELVENPKLIVPSDVVVEGVQGKKTKMAFEVLEDEMILDAGPATIKIISDRLSSAKFVLWNGTLGAYEHGFAEGTLELAKALVKSGAESIVGGGDTIASLADTSLLEKFSFVSTGGGAMLDFLANETLPGIEALEKGVR